MKIVRITAAALAAMMVLATGCSKKEDLSQYDVLLRKWCRSLRDLNYANYRACEAHPKSAPVFQEMYRDYYFEDIMIVDIEDPDDENRKKDPEGNEFRYRGADFECSEVSRRTGRPTQVVRGNVLFVRYLEGPRKGDGRLLSNRTIVRIKR